MTTKRKVTKQKTIWVARQVKDTGFWDQDEYLVFVQKVKPELTEEVEWDGSKSQYFEDSPVTELCATEWHRATGIRLKRGEVVKIKVSVVK